MRKLISTVLVLIIFSCGSESINEGESNSEDLTIEENGLLADFDSEIRPDFSWKVGEVYQDTLVFDSFDSNYDYWYAFFKNSENKLISFSFDDIIADDLKGSVMLVEWEIDTLYEAGEGDEPYLKEVLRNYTILEKKSEFSGFLSEFIKAYSRQDDDLIEKFLNADLGFKSAYRIGVYCAPSQETSPQIKKFINWECNISNEMPVGDFCEGYPGAEDGMYYKSINENELPTFADPSMEEFKAEQLPDKFENALINKVIIIKDEWTYNILYFVQIDGSWFLWLEDNCDCSA
ncbi:hypothetical protein K6119_03385 [Paracrocinitomix mangrovi]|uniref:hypothetical protein n=1 Tax=Paracrocinitomix mangrovi TaxID=2862509 RepID=UPI001C8DF9CD|nr:hypothetical protein [Paracrocinitomix mangrovi]UKN02558.1 hypothetical protein K6119_03385 [Paracrocinitomix mangrovi]